MKSSSTGVDHLKILKKEISEDELNSLLPKKVVSSILADMKDDSTEVTIKLGEGSELMVKKTSKRGEGSELLVEKNGNNHYYSLTIQAAHEHQIGKVIPLPLTEESDGTQRLLNLIPALHHLRTSSGVFFIDEIDRSMHPILVWKFLEFFLKSCNNCQCQIIVTTHESNLLDLDLLRRDEIWFAEKDLEGATRLYPLTDFKVRKDLEIRKHYMQGRFGAVPFLGNLDHLLENEGNPE